MPDLPRKILKQMTDAITVFGKKNQKFETDATDLQEQLLIIPGLEKLIQSPRTTLKRIMDAIIVFEKERQKFETDATNLLNRLLSNSQLKHLIHSFKTRAKEPSHLCDKLIRKAIDAKKNGETFRINSANIFDKLPDLAGVRLLHLNMRQMEKMHPLIMEVLESEGYVLRGKPEAKTWDPEYEQMFRQLNLKVIRKESLYTSVHYVVKQNKTTSRLCELQVRTLAEEIWGEISHTINYPHETDSIACKEQLKVLARVVSGCSRLVDSITASYQDHCNRSGRVRRIPPRQAPTVYKGKKK